MTLAGVPRATMEGTLYHFDDYGQSPKGGQNGRLDSLFACRPCRSIHQPKGLLRRWLESFTTPDQPPTGHAQALFLIQLMLMLIPPAPAKESNPHIPFKLTEIRILLDRESYETLYHTTHMAPLNTWWPDLHFCFCDLNHIYRAMGQKEDRRYSFYMCPGNLRDKKQCGGLESSFCKSWACVTSNEGEWKWSEGKQELVNFM